MKEIQGGNSPLIWNETLVIHTTAVKAIITLFLFQMAMLERAISIYSWKIAVTQKH